MSDKVSESREEAIEFIKKVKHFGETELGIDFCGSFKEVAEDCTYYYWLTLSYPFLMKRPYRRAGHLYATSDRKVMQKYTEECKNAGFDAYIFQGEAYDSSSNPCPILPSLLEATRARQVNVVLHEGMHSMLDGPPFRRNYDLNESAVSVLGYAGGLDFAEYFGDQALQQELLLNHDWWLRFCDFINWGVVELSRVYRISSLADLPEVRRLTLSRIIDEAITLKIFTEGKDELQREFNNAYLLHDLPYTTLYRVFLEAHRIRGSDTKKTMQVFRALPPKRKDALAELYAIVGK